MKGLFVRLVLIAGSITCPAAAAAQGADNTPPPGFTALFNGKDLTGRTAPSWSPADEERGQCEDSPNNPPLE
jgi:hypothetical protein